MKTSEHDAMCMSSNDGSHEKCKSYFFKKDDLVYDSMGRIKALSAISRYEFQIEFMWSIIEKSGMHLEAIHHRIDIYERVIKRLKSRL